MKIITTLALAITAIQAQADNNQIQGGAPFVTVGAGDTCDYDSIQAAITGNLSNTIRIASDKAYIEAITIHNKNLTMTGGYASCANAESNLTDLSKAPISGTDSGTLITISGNDQVRDINLRHLALGNGDVAISSTADANIVMNDLVIINNNDAGVFLFGGDNTVTMEDVFINGNEGSAVICLGENNVVAIQGDSEISDNESAGVGGGLAISGECKANVYAPTVISNNTAATHGGGVYVEDGALVNLRGVEVSYNQADANSDNDGEGGGLYVKDALSIVNATNVTFEGNSAYSGGAVSASENGRFTSYSENTQSNPCNTPGKCSQYKGNSAQSRGGVLNATSEGQIKVLHAEITGNGLLGQPGLVANAALNGSVTIEGSMIVKNGGEDLPGSSLFNVMGLGANNEPSITLNHVTVADNHVSDEVIRNYQGVFNMYASIVQDDVDVINAISPDSQSFECVMAHEIVSISGGGTVTENDPEFINPSASNYHLKPSSPAIDYCYDAEPLTVELGYDIDFENRNYDDPNVDDLHGHYDIGADEYRWDNDLIFMNGFEQD